MTEQPVQRHLGLFGATMVGIGAIVGGGILALAGTAFATTGPSAILAFALNGLIALLTALSFAEVSSKFPQSGGTYTFAKKVLTVETAFTVGWVVWFASIVAAVLYSLGFGEFAARIIYDLWESTGRQPPDWLSNRIAVRGLALAATVGYTIVLMRRPAGGGRFVNMTKIIVFGVLVVCGLSFLPGHSLADLRTSLKPFFANGTRGLLQAMGFTFIALQGFDLIAAVAGEIRQPERNIPRAMLFSLGLSLLIYLPLLLVVMTVGMPAGVSVTDAARRNPETIIAVAAQNYLGSFGYWLVMVAAILSMLSALHVNLFAASRVAMAMANDRTLPQLLSRLGKRGHTPYMAVLLTAAIVGLLLLVLRDVAAAGAAASLIFLVTFSLAHWIAVLVRQRSADRPPPFRTPLFPLIPICGGLACVALAVYQGISVPAAGGITLAWLCIGGLLFLGLFAHRARLADVWGAARDPELIRLRGLSPLVLVPIANPRNAHSLVAVASALAPPDVGRVLMLSVAVAPQRWDPTENPEPLQKVHAVLNEAFAATLQAGLSPEALATVASEPWSEIARVARSHACESLLLGLSDLSEESLAAPLEQLVNQVDSDIVVMRAPQGWQLNRVRRILVPTAGRGGHDRLLARLLGSLSRTEDKELEFLRVMPQTATEKERQAAHRDVTRMADALYSRPCQVRIVNSDDPVETVARRAEQCDLLIMGVQRLGRQKLFGQFALQVARRTEKPLLLISRRG